MRTLTMVFLAVGIAAATSVDLGIGVGFDNTLGEAPQPIPMLSAGFTLGETYTASANLAAVGYSSAWEFMATAALGYGPIRGGITVSEEGQIGSMIGFEAPLGQYGRIFSRVLNIESDRPVYAVTGLTLTL